MRFGGKAPILKGMLIFQMFPPVLSLVAIYALFPTSSASTSAGSG